MHFQSLIVIETDLLSVRLPQPLHGPFRGGVLVKKVVFIIRLTGADGYSKWNNWRDNEEKTTRDRQLEASTLDVIIVRCCC